jgi:Lauroyl/myristoyl acyltransferase
LQKFFLKSVSSLPLGVLYCFSKPVYFLLFYLLRFRRTIVENNIKNSFPELNSDEQRLIIKKHYANFVEIAIEILKSISIAPEELAKHVKFENAEILNDALQNNQTIMLSLAHHCNQEWALLAITQNLHYPLDGIYKPLHIEWLNELAVESRSKFNTTLIPAKTCVTDLIKRAKQTRIIAIAADQAPRRRDDAFWIDFLNQETPFYTGLEKIATLFKYPVFFMHLRRESRGQYVATFTQIAKPPYEKESKEITTRYAQAIEEQILEQPENWLWIHKRWKKAKSVYE